MKKLAILLLAGFTLSGCAELQQVAGQLPQGGSVLSTADIAAGLRAALDKGIDTQVSKLTQTDGFYKNQLVKILLPEELQKVDSGLRSIGLSSLADEGIKMMNRAAEDAVREATPIFVSAVKQITFTDAKNILLGNDQAATNYLERTTTTQLYSKFNPVIKTSFSKVGADKVWNNLISRYNTLTGNKIDTNLNAYVTQQAINGVFNMVAEKEAGIRGNKALQTTSLLQQVFGSVK